MRDRLNRSGVAGVALILGLTGCGADEGSVYQTQQSALVSDSYQAVVPAYFTPNQDAWTTFNRHAPTFVILGGPNNMPPGPGMSDWTSRVSALKASGIKVIGYVDLKYGTPYNTFALNLDYWDSYNVDGMFFDESWRSPGQNDLNKLSWLVRHEQQMWSPARYTFFNFGSIDPTNQHTVDCLATYAIQGTGDGDSLLRFVTSETTAATYLLPPTNTNSAAYMFAHNTWVQQYLPIQFINIVNQGPSDPAITTNDVDNIFTNSAAFNAKSVYITDYTGANTYGGGMASAGLWDYQAGKWPQTASFPGTATTHAPTACPVPSVCDHDLCTADQGPLNTWCDACAGQVCQQGDSTHQPDDYCCTNNWDSICVGEAQQECGPAYASECG